VTLILAKYYLNHQSCSKIKRSSTNGLLLLVDGGGERWKKPLLT